MNIKIPLKYFDAEMIFTPTVTNDEKPVLFEFIDFCYQAGLKAGFTNEQLNKYFTEKINKYYT